MQAVQELGTWGRWDLPWETAVSAHPWPLPANKIRKRELSFLGVMIRTIASLHKEICLIPSQVQFFSSYTYLTFSVLTLNARIKGLSYLHFLSFSGVPIHALRPAVIRYPCWRPIPPLPTMRSSSTPSAGSPIHPSLPNSHPPPLLLEVKLTPLCPVVILQPCWQPTSELPYPADIFHPSC